MPLFYQRNIDEVTRLAIWKIEEGESYFNETVPLQATITHGHKRLQHLAGRYLLRYLFADFPYEDMVIAATRKPYLANEAYHFSISHCGDYAAALVSKKYRVGIDIETPHEKVRKVAKKFLHPTEQASFGALEANANLQQLTLLWCAKEALFKWWGLGAIDFAEMMRLEHFTMHNNGNFKAHFKEQTLQMSYELFPKLCLCWVMS